MQSILLRELELLSWRERGTSIEAEGYHLYAPKSCKLTLVTKLTLPVAVRA